jgi:ferredoxin
LLHVPPILARESAEHLAGTGMFDLSRLLLSGRKIDVLVTTHPADDPNLDAADEQFAGNRLELAYLGISHRDAQVHQSSAARPHHLIEGFLSSLDSTTPALHVVADCRTTEGNQPRLGAWMNAAAALEGRAHPYSHYNPAAGSTWARRFDFADNPQPEAEWPTYDLPCRTADGRDESQSMAFTFADFALLERRYLTQFRVIPAHGESEDLVVLAEFLVLNQEESIGRIPFIWATDGQGGLHRIAVSARLVAACRDRLDYWRTLQELAGIGNEHVREAVEYEREVRNAEFRAEREQLESAHAAELERVRHETAGEAFQRLAEALLGMDLSTLGASIVQTPDATAAPAAAPTEEAEAEVPAVETTAEEIAEEEDVADEPWIDSALCTTCNDCMKVNAQVFLYNSNKQAYIGDAKAGTFAEMVKAAEICPAHCIHPGKPLNPGEENLDELIERARPFQ